MSYGPKQVFNTTIVSGTSTTGAIDLGDKSYTQLAVNVASATTNALMTVFACLTSTGTFLPVQERVNTAPVQHQTLTVATSASGAWAMMPCPPFRYLKLAGSAVVDGGATITVICQD